MYPWQMPFVCGIDAMEPERRDTLDVYADEDRQGPSPAVVFVHGGPLPSGLPVTPRDWPIYRGYAALAAQAGLVAVVFDHGLHQVQDYSVAYAQLLAAIDAARAQAVVDASRVAVCAFSGAAPPLTAPLLRDPPEWLRCIALTYPILDSTPGLRLPDDYRPVDALNGNAVPVVLTRVGREDPAIDAAVVAFLSRAQQAQSIVQVIEVQEGQHRFDALPPVVDACAAVQTALDAVRIDLTR